MSFSTDPPVIGRMGIPEVMKEVINELNHLKEGASLSIADIAWKLQCDRRTVEKVIDMIIEIQQNLRTKDLLKEKPHGARSYLIYLRDSSARARAAIESAGKRLKRKKE